MILRHNRRLIATKEILVGQEFKENINFGIFRALKDQPKALSPFQTEVIEGKRAKRRIKIGNGITEEDI